MKTKKLTCEKARNIAILAIMANLGFIPVRINEKEAWFLSPFRSETQASFKVDLRLNRWYDHGIGKGGNILDLIMQLKNFSVTEALHFLSNDISSFSFHQQPNFEIEKSYSIQKIQKLSNTVLINYLTERGIKKEIAKQYCQEIYYTLKNKRYFAVAFKNNSTGYEIRNKYFKGGLGKKDNTHIKNGYNSISIFEGFIDFLSYKSLDEMPKRNEDYLILNSVSLVDEALPKLKEYETICCYLDNDASGVKTTQLIKEHYPKSMDCSFTFNNHKDLNEYLISKSNHYERQNQN